MMVLIKLIIHSNRIHYKKSKRIHGVVFLKKTKLTHPLIPHLRNGFNIDYRLSLAIINLKITFYRIDDLSLKLEIDEHLTEPPGFFIFP